MRTVVLLLALGILPMAAGFAVARTGNIRQVGTYRRMSEAEETEEAAEVAEAETEEVVEEAPVAMEMEAPAEVSAAKAALMAYADSIPGPVGSSSQMLCLLHKFHLRICTYRLLGSSRCHFDRLLGPWRGRHHRLPPPRGDQARPRRYGWLPWLLRSVDGHR